MLNWFLFINRDRRDANRRRPGDADYDPKNLYLPSEFLKGLSGGQVIHFFWLFGMYVFEVFISFNKSTFVTFRDNGGILSQSTWTRFCFSRYKFWLGEYNFFLMLITLCCFLNQTIFLPCC